jgi:hypothetical protein
VAQPILCKKIKRNFYRGKDAPIFATFDFLESCPKKTIAYIIGENTPDPVTLLNDEVENADLSATQL